MLEDGPVRTVGLFSGIGGLELGLQRAGVTTELLCEYWDPAAVTLRKHFDVPVVGDIRSLGSLPSVDIVTAGFPCTDLSQVGRTAGIDGDESGLVREVFRLIDATPPKWVVLENVPNMLSLSGGAPIKFITEWFEERGWNWAYRTVDSQHFGVRQRRRRVILVASQSEDPRTVLFADEAGAKAPHHRHKAFGFYWTEGNRGLGWGVGVTPTLKGGSKLGIASPPAVWLPAAEVGLAVTRPKIEAGERLQGFPAGWTEGAGKDGIRWKLVGNAVTVPVASWVGRRLACPGEVVDAARRPLASSWPGAAANIRGEREEWHLSERPLAAAPGLTLDRLLRTNGADPLSHKATAGFTKRLKASRLRSVPGFVEALDAHIEAVASSTR